MQIITSTTVNESSRKSVYLGWLRNNAGSAWLESL